MRKITTFSTVVLTIAALLLLTSSSPKNNIPKMQVRRRSVTHPTFWVVYQEFQ